MPKQVQLRRGTTAQHSSFTGAQGEITYDTDKKTIVLHDGVTAGGRPQDRYIEKTPATIQTLQTISGPINLAGGDSETYSLAVQNQANVNQLICNADLQVKRLIKLQEGITYATSININFQTYGAKRISLTGNITFTGSGYLFGSEILVFITCDGTQRNLTFPAGWVFIGAAAPANIAASKRGLLQLWSTGTTEADVWARWLVQP
jgi:hypothetical protein